MFPRASKSFLDENQHILAGRGAITPKDKKNSVHETPNRSEIQNPKSKRHQTPALVSAIQGKTESVQRTRIRFTGYRVRPLDPDNFAGGCKDLLDGLRHSGIILGDEPWRIIFETAQEKVKTYAEERTVIEIETLPVSE